MGSKKGLISIALAFVLLIGCAYILYSNLGQEAAPDQIQNNNGDEEKVPAPDFVAYDAQGNAVKLSDYFGKPIVLNFWATWCTFCEKEMPDFQAKYDELKDEVQFIMVNVTDGDRETVQTASDYVKEKGYTFPVLYDLQLSAAMAYGANSLPVTFFIDKDGNARAQAVGALDAEGITKGLELTK